MQSPVKNPLFDLSTWKRALFIVLFALAFQVVELAIGLVVAVQLLAKLFVGDTFAQLERLGGWLGDYARHVVRFLTFATDELPFPFAPARVDDVRPGSEGAEAGC